MSQSAQSFILVIDDKHDDLQAQFELALGDRLKAIVVHPREVKMPHLKDADLVLVDFILDDWLERDGQPVSLRPATGLALATVLREQVDHPELDGLTAFALHTAHLDDIRGRLPPATAEHVVARLNNLEWAFQKTEPCRYDQMATLADAVRQLPSKWPIESEDAAEMVRGLLGMEVGFNSFERCWQDVLDCRVPVHNLNEGVHGILFARWLLHEILPYPSFLWSENWVAARLGITVESLREVVSGNSPLAADLESMCFSGILATFLGKRWWRGTLEDYVWKLGSQSKKEERTLLQALDERAQMELEPIDLDPALVSLDVTLKPTGYFLSPMDAVTLRPDHWPTFADPAWMDIEEVRGDPYLLSIVDPLDLRRVEKDDEWV